MNFSRRGNIAGYFIVGSSDVPLHIALLEKPDTEFCDTIWRLFYTYKRLHKTQSRT